MRHIQGKKTILARCRLHHASSVTFEIALILLTQTSNISYNNVLKIILRMLKCNISFKKKCKFLDIFRMKILKLFQFGFQS